MTWTTGRGGDTETTGMGTLHDDKNVLGNISLRATSTWWKVTMNALFTDHHLGIVTRTTIIIPAVIATAGAVPGVRTSGDFCRVTAIAMATPTAMGAETDTKTLGSCRHIHIMDITPIANTMSRMSISTSTSHRGAGVIETIDLCDRVPKLVAGMSLRATDEEPSHS